MAIQRTIYLEEDLFLQVVQRKRISRRSLSKEINVMLETLLKREAGDDLPNAPAKAAAGA